jgi:transcriptional regulator with XRE-family HTH domain
MKDFKLNLYERVGEKIKNQRVYLGKSQVDLAKDLHLSRSTISNIEVGRHQVTLVALYHIAQMLDTKVKDLLPDDSVIFAEIDFEERFSVFLEKNNIDITKLSSEMLESLRNAYLKL